MGCGCPVANVGPAIPTPAVGASPTQTCPEKEYSPKSGVTTLVLLLTLGGFSAHRFYAGKYGTATLQMLLFILGLAFMVLGGILIDQYYWLPRQDLVGLVLAFCPFFLGGWLVWVIVDLVLICQNNFTDENGLPIKI